MALQTQTAAAAGSRFTYDSARYRREREAMLAIAPGAAAGILQTTSQLYWLVECGVGDETVTFMLLYSKAFPESDEEDAPAVKVIPVVPDAQTVRGMLDESCGANFRRDEGMNTEYICLRPGTYSNEITAADYCAELVRWLAAGEEADNEI